MNFLLTFYQYNIFKIKAYAKGTFMDKKTFEDLNLKESILKAIKDLGYETPSQIQAESIPIAIKG